MKNILTIAILLISFTASAQLGNLKKTSNDKLVWSKIYDEVLGIESQEIDLTGPSKFNSPIYMRDLKQAKMTVEVQDGKTRVYISNIMMASIIGTSLRVLDSPVLEDISPVVISKRKGAFKKFFIKRDAKTVDSIISRAVRSVIEERTW